MSSSSSSSSSSGLSTSGNRYAGLMSGLDTEELVKAMSANTKNRINTKKQKLQTLQWQQEGYRDIISKISGFQKTYLDLLSTSSIKANAVMKKFAATSSSTKVTATAGTSAAACKYAISQATSATASSVSSSAAAASGSVTLDFSNNTTAGTPYSVDVTLDGSTKTVKFTGSTDADTAKANFLSAVNTTFTGIKNASQSFKFKDGSSALIFADTADTSGTSVTTDGILHSFGVGYNNAAVGLVNTTSSKITTDSVLGDVDFKQDLQFDNGNCQININGTEFMFNESTTIGDMITKINNSKAGVKMTFSSVSQTFKLETKTTGAGAELDVSQSRGNLLNALFNNSSVTSTNAASGTPTYNTYGPTSSGAVNYDIANGFANAGDALYNLNLTLSDGSTKDIALDLSALTAKTQSVDADGNKLYTMHASTGDVTITAKVQGDGTTAYNDTKSGKTLFFEDASGDFYKAKLEDGVAVIDTANPYKLSDGTTIMTELSELGIFEKCDTVYSNTEINQAIKTQLDSAFSGEANVPDGLSVTYSSGKISVAATKKVIVNANDFNITSGSSTETVNKYTSTSQTIVKNPSESEKAEMTFTLNGAAVTVTAADSTAGITIKQLTDAGLFSFNSSTGELVAKGDITSTGTTAAWVDSIFGSAGGSISGPSATNNMTSTQGQNATLTVSADGGTPVKLTSASNIFTMDGTSINITNLGDFNPTDQADYITVDTKRDTTSIKDTVVKFVNDYNTLLKGMYTAVQTSRPKSGKSYYDPLTEEQEDEMEQTEIDKWEEQAKTGLLYHDDTISKFVSSFRSAMTTASNGMELGSMGITVSKKPADYGQLTVDESKLDKAITNYGEEVADYFTNPDTGLAANLNSTIDSAISTKTKHYGYMTLLAGVENDPSSTKNMLYSQIDSLQDIITNLETKYKSEQERYWAKFTRLETYMSNMSSQSSMFSSSSQ